MWSERTFCSFGIRLISLFCSSSFAKSEREAENKRGIKEGERRRFEMLNRALVVQGQLLHPKNTTSVCMCRCSCACVCV